ncbi:MAG: hypothetical protein GY782_03510 [Gammaproteobacteria bacterium]|nr:hypothetical protein [Gammaproteobacteria bacterium]
MLFLKKFYNNSRRKTVSLLLGSILGMVFSCLAQAQQLASTTQSQLSDTAAEPLKWWLTLGIGGLGTQKMEQMSGIGTTIELNYNFSKHQLVTARITGYRDNDNAIFGDALCGMADGICSVDKGFGRDYALLYGVIGRNHYGYLSASTGLSYFRGQQSKLVLSNGQDENTNPVETSVGLPVELQAFYYPWRSFGIGIIGSGDINSKASFFGALTAIQLAF